jgi:multicomponent Na+:H+ antiporter subunit D
MHPAFVLFAAAFGVAITRGKLRQAVLIAGPLLTLLALTQLGSGSHWTFVLPTYTLHVLQVDTLSHVFGLVFSLIAGIGAFYALHVQRGSEHVATLVYAGASLGVVFAGDWLTLFVFWELMAVASLFVVWYGNTPGAQAAGFRYLFVHIFGGSLLFCGILLHLADGGALTLQALTTDATRHSAAFWLILLGVAINAAIPPLHAWLPDAYPEASITGSVFLSAFTTKTAVYVLIRLFPGADILVWAGVIMALYGVVYAVLANDMRSLLAYHIVSQVGYMVAGVGMGTALALNGTVAHAFCHILYKALLFMGAGAVIQATGKRKLTELGGIAASMPLVLVLYMVGAVSISGFPLFNGFISKSMIISAAAEDHLPVAELLLTLTSIGTFLSTTLKFPYFAFFGPDRGLQPRPVPKNMLLAMGVGAFFCIALGILPGWLYVRLPFAATYHPYTVDHIVSALQLLFGTGIGFWLLLKKLSGEAAVSLDTDWFYRKPLLSAVNACVAGARQIGMGLEGMRSSLLHHLLPYVQNPYLVMFKLGFWPRPIGGMQRHDSPSPAQDARIPYDADTYRLPIGVTVLWIVICFTLAALYTLGRRPAA